jgi:hypothetical protein
MILKTIERILSEIRGADTDEHEAEAARHADTKAARARERKREGQKQLRALKLEARHAALQTRNQALAKLADERAVLTDRAADLTGELGKITDRIGLIDRKLSAARRDVDRFALNPTLAVTVRLDPAIDRLVPPRECELLDGAVWTGLVVEGMRRGTGGAWAVDFVFDERSGQLVGEPKYHYDLSDEERRTRRQQIDREIAERRKRLTDVDPSGQAQWDASRERLNEVRR